MSGITPAETLGVQDMYQPYISFIFNRWFLEGEKKGAQEARGESARMTERAVELKRLKRERKERRERERLKKNAN